MRRLLIESEIHKLILYKIPEGWLMKLNLLTQLSDPPRDTIQPVSALTQPHV